jgi:hydroxyacylglutathione hydrolase
VGAGRPPGRIANTPAARAARLAPLRQLADDLYLLDGFPRYAVNVYLMGDVLVDAGTRHAARRILRQIGGRTVSTHALTHAHGDHQGSSHVLCEELRLPLWCGEHDADAVEDGLIAERLPAHALNRIVARAFPGPAHPVARRLREGDVVGGFTVLDTPGHSPGHVSFWRESDRTLVCGDVYSTLDVLTGFPGLHEPRSMFTPDPARNRASMRRLAALEPALMCVGHGPPWRNPAKLRSFARALRYD